MTAQQHDSPHDKSGVYSSTPIYREGIREQDIPSILSDFDLHLFGQGKEYRIYEKMGAHLLVVNGVTGVNFALWAPNARSVSVIGDFNGWQHGATPMHLRHQDLGVWECFVPGLTAGALYRYAITSRFNDYTVEKSDPYGFAAELRPQTASIVVDIHQHQWQDEAWMQVRAERQQLSSPISIYELDIGSWRRMLDRPGEHRLLIYRELAHTLAPYIKDLGFTHVELLPMTEYPYDGSWGYQVTGYFAPTSRYGSPEDFQYLVDYLHQQDIGVLLDWVPSHFPKDGFALSYFDGTHLYEYADPRKGEHKEWGTYVFDYGRAEVRNFLLASALFWLREYHIDGLRVDAVASMLYRDYSRKPGEWIPNRYGGRENLEAIEFLRRLNAVLAERCPGAITIAEDSTAWPGVTAPVSQGGLGFSYKWNMGWMHDTLRYLGRDPAHRRWHHEDLTFGLLYAFSEKFILPLSHDEVVYGKNSLLGRASGDAWQKLANLRAYFGFMWTHPGKKLLFMGNEIGQKHEWSHDGQVAWDVLHERGHAGLQHLVGDLNRLYRRERALQGDADPSGFRWIIGDDEAQSVFAYERRFAGAKPIVAIVNMTPVPRWEYRIGVPFGGRWRELINTDSSFYGGSNLGNGTLTNSQPHPAHGYAQSLSLLLPPLATLVLQPEN